MLQLLKQKRLVKSVLIIFCVIMLALLCISCQKDEEDTPIYSTISDLEGKRVGVVTGTTFDTMATNIWENCELVHISTFEDLVPALTGDKIDCFLSDKPWIVYVASVNDDLTFIDETIASEEYGLIFSKKENVEGTGTALRDDFNVFLAELPDKQATFDELDEIWLDADSTHHPTIDYKSLPAINGTIRIGTTVANPPFEYYENGNIVGYNIHLLYLYCQARGYAMTIEDAKFDSLIAGVVGGRYDIASGSFTITEERKESVNFSDPIYCSGPVVAIRSENAVAQTGEEDNDNFWYKTAESFKKTFVRENRWKMFLDGIGLTILITIASLVCGTCFGFLLFMWYRKGDKVSKAITGFLSWLITGMPEVLLLMILYYIVFGHTAITGAWVSVMAFTLIVGVNVLGMIKSGVMAVDRGQTEAALAIGYSERRGFFRIILPQALQHIMPGYKESIVTLIKSTAIVGYLAVQDLTKVSDIVRSRTYEAFFPLIATAAIYFVLAWFLVLLVDFLQKHLLPIRKNSKTILKGIDTGKEETNQ